MSESKTDNPISEMFPYLRVRDAKKAIEFYEKVFGAEELARLVDPSGRIGHAQLKIGPAIIMLSDEHPELGIMSPLAYGGTGQSIHLHVANVDAITRRAVELGAKVISEPKDQFYGERTSKIVDPFGHEWMFGQHLEDVSFDEMQRRYSETAS